MRIRFLASVTEPAVISRNRRMARPALRGFNRGMVVRHMCIIVSEGGAIAKPAAAGFYPVRMSNTPLSPRRGVPR